MNLWRVAIDENSGQVLHEPEPATTPATDMVHLAISRDGRRMAYVQRTKQRRLQAIGFDSVSGTTREQPVTITKGTSFATHPSVSPDGNWIAYSSSGGPREDLFIIRKDGTGLRQLTNDAAKDRLPRWSPDGKRIAFFSDRENKNEIWAVSIEGTNLEQLTFTGRRAVYPAWSPDGTRLAYYDYGIGTFIIDVRRPWQDQTPQPITVGGKIDPDLAVWDWSKDGKKLACVNLPNSPQEFSTSIYSFGSTEAPPQLLSVGGHSDLPVWLSDGSRLIYTANDRLYVVSVDTKSTHELFAPNSNQTAEYPTLSPDNRTLYYSLATTEADIWLATIE
jgi:eukaryotic-like serine/threonine-protein kinase